MTPEQNIDKAARLLKGYSDYEGTAYEDFSPPNERDVQRAQAHALTAIAQILAKANE